MQVEQELEEAARESVGQPKAWPSWQQVVEAQMVNNLVKAAAGKVDEKEDDGCGNGDTPNGGCGIAELAKPQKVVRSIGCGEPGGLRDGEEK